MTRTTIMAIVEIKAQIENIFMLLSPKARLLIAARPETGGDTESPKLFLRLKFRGGQDHGVANLDVVDRAIAVDRHDGIVVINLEDFDRADEAAVVADGQAGTSHDFAVVQADDGEAVRRVNAEDLAIDVVADFGNIRQNRASHVVKRVGGEILDRLFKLLVLGFKIVLGGDQVERPRSGEGIPRRRSGRQRAGQCHPQKADFACRVGWQFKNGGTAD